MKKRNKLRSIPITMVSCLIVFQSSFIAFAATPQDSLKIQSEKKIAPGTTYKEFSQNIGGTNVVFREVEVDLKNPNIKIAPMYGNNDQVGGSAKVSTMASQNGAIAAINSSFFRTDNEGATLGMLIKDGKPISSPAKVPDWNTFVLTKDGQAIIGAFGFSGQIKAPNGKAFPIEGLNKTEYFAPGSMASNYSGTIHVFNRDWGPNSRGLLDGYGDILEVEVKDNIVTDIRANQGPKPIPANGYVLYANGEGAQFLKDNFKIGDTVDVSYHFTPDQLGITEAIGANYLLVDGGAPVSQFPTDSDLTGKHSRSALGINQNGTTMYLVSVDRSDTNPGVTLPELANFLINLGAYRGVNLDGGSSTSLVIEQPGDLGLTRVNDGSISTEHPVADAIGIFNTAPKGDPDHLEINGPKQVFVGQQSKYSFKGWDTYLHPIDPSTVTWSVTDGIGEAAGSSILWKKGGNAQINVQVAGKTQSYPVYVIGKEVIQKIALPFGEVTISPNQQQDMKVSVQLANGDVFVPGPDQVKWTIDNDKIGKLVNNTFVASGETGTATIKADVFGVTAQATIHVSYSFDDTQEHWARDSIEKMATKGYAKGTGDRQFSPDKSLTRADFVVFLSRILNWNVTEEDKKIRFNEKVPDYASDVLKYAKRTGVIVGDQAGKINPYKPISRVEAAAILARVLATSDVQPSTNILKKNYEDWADIPDWGKNSVQLLTEKQIFGGMNHKFYPNKDITRAEMVTVLLRAIVKE